MQIPKQLQNENFRFIILKKKGKEPLKKIKFSDPAHQYKYNEPELLEKMKKGNNYGVLGGCGFLLPIDADTKELTKLACKKLDTFTIRTGREDGEGHHLYVTCKDWSHSTIPLEDAEGNNIGHIKGDNAYLVGPKSIHPSGNEYKIVNNAQIIEVTEKEILKLFKPYIKRLGKKRNISEFIGKKYDIKKVVKFYKKNSKDSNVLKCNRETSYGFQTAHPIHGSTGGKNLDIDTEKNCFHCFHCNTGGGALHLIAILEEFVECREINKKPLRKLLTSQKYVQLLEIAKEKYHQEVKTDSIKKEKLLEKYRVITEEGNKKIKVSHVGLAELIMNEHDFHFITTFEDNTIYFYNDSFYEPKGENHIRNTAEYYLERFSNEQRKKEVVGHIRDASYQKREIFDAPVNLINFKNGVLDIKTGKLLPHSPEYKFLQEIPHNYKPDAKCPKFKNFFKQILTKKDTVLIQEFFGHGFYRDYFIQVLVIFIGEGANGKGTLLRVFKKVLGEENISSMELAQLRTPEAASQLFGKLANLGGDLPKTAIKDSGMIKKLTGQDQINARYLYHEGFNFENYATLIFSTNDPPEIIDQSYAMNRRLVQVEFPYKFVGKEETDRIDNENIFPKDTRILDGLTSEIEIEGIIAWSIEGLKRILKQGEVSYRKSPEKSRDEYERRSNPVYAFVLDCIKENRDMCILQMDLYEKGYKLYMVENYPNKPILAKGVFTKKLRAQPIPLEEYRPNTTGRPRYWYGIECHTFPTINVLKDKIQEKPKFATKKDILNKKKETDEGSQNKLTVKKDEDGDILITSAGGSA